MLAMVEPRSNLRSLQLPTASLLSPFHQVLVEWVTRLMYKPRHFQCACPMPPPDYRFGGIRVGTLQSVGGGPVWIAHANEVLGS